MISLKKFSLTLLGFNAILSILTILVHQGDIIIHWNSQQTPDQTAPVFMAVVVPIIAGVLYCLSSSFRQQKYMRMIHQYSCFNTESLFLSQRTTSKQSKLQSNNSSIRYF